MANNSAQFNLGIKTSADLSGVNQIKKALEEVRKIASEGSGFFDVNEIKQMTSAANTLERALNGAFDVRLNTVNIAKFNDILKQSNTSITEIQNGLSYAGAAGQKAFLGMTSQLFKVNSVMKQSNTFLTNFAKTVGNTIRYQAINSALQNITNGVSQAYGYVKSLDTSLNNIQIVTEKNADSMARFAKEANKAAQSLGAKTTDYTDASLIYYQQGLSDAEVKGRTDTTMKMANVLGDSADEVSQYMTAIWNNFDNGSKSLEYYGDVITSLGAHTASSAEEIAQGLEKFASVAETTGLSYEYATAALATVTAETRQSADVVGTAFKTLFARIQDLELGDEGSVSIGKYAEALDKVGIQVLDVNGNLKEMDAILNEMGSKWDSLSKSQQTALAQNVGGTRQYPQLIALMENWDKVKENIQIATDATGTLEDKQAIYMESTAAHLKASAAAWENFYDSMLNRDTINTLADASAVLGNGMANFADSVGGIIPMLTSLGATGMRVFSAEIGQALSGVINSFKIFTDSSKIAQQNMAGLREMLGGNTWAGTMGVAESGALTSTLNQMQGLYSEIVQYGSVMNAQQKAHYEGLVNELNLIGYEKIEIEDVVSELSSLSGQANNPLFNTSLDEQGIEKIKTLSQAAAELNSRVQGSVNLVFDLNMGLKDLPSDTASSLNSVFDSLENELKDNTSQASKLYDALSKVKGISIQNGKFSIGDEFDKNSLERVKFLISNFSQYNQKLAALGPQLESIESRERMVADAGKAMSESLSLGYSIQQITNVVGALGQLAMGIQTIVRLPSIWKNEDISSGEKLLQTITNFSFVLPNLIAGFDGLNKVLGITEQFKVLNTYLNTIGVSGASVFKILKSGYMDTAAAQAISTAAMEKNIASNEVDRIQEELTIATKEKRRLVEENKTTFLIQSRIEELNKALATATDTVAEKEATRAALERAVAEQKAAAAIAARRLATIGAFAAIAIAVGAAVAIYDKLHISVEEANKAFEEHSQKCNDDKQALESLNNELETTIERIAELKDKLANGSITLTEKDELTKLQATNAELKAEIASKEKLLEIDRETAAQDIINRYNAGGNYDKKVAFNGPDSSAISIDLANALYSKLQGDSAFESDSQLQDLIYNGKGYESLSDEAKAKLESELTIIFESVGEYSDAVRENAQAISNMLNNGDLTDAQAVELANLHEQAKSDLEYREFLPQNIIDEAEQANLEYYTTLEQFPTLVDGIIDQISTGLHNLGNLDKSQDLENIVGEDFENLIVDAIGTESTDALYLYFESLGLNAEAAIKQLINTYSGDELVTAAQKKEIQSTEEVIRATDELQEQYKSLATIMKSVKDNMNLSTDDYNKLPEAAREYFAEMADGTYQLIGDAKELVRILNGTQRETIYNSIASVQQQRNKLSSNLDLQKDLARINAIPTINTKGLINSKNLEDRISALENSGDKRASRWRAEVASFKGDFEVQKKVIKEINTAFDSLKSSIDLNVESYKILGNELESLQQSLAFSAQTLTELEGMRGSSQINSKQYDKALDPVTQTEAESYGLNFEDVKDQAEILLSIDEAQKLNATSARQLAMQNQLMNKGLTDLSSNWNDWKKTLTSSDKASTDYLKTIQSLRTAVRNLVGVTENMDISADFLGDPKNFELIEKAATGDKAAISKLGAEVSKASIDMMQFNDAAVEAFQQEGLLDKAFNIDDFETLKEKVKNGIDEIQTDLSSLEPGDAVQGMDIEWTTALNDMAMATQMSVEEMNNLLNSMGVQAEVKTAWQKQEVQVPEYTVEMTEQKYDKNGQLTSYKMTTTQTGTKTVEGGIEVAQINTGDMIGNSPQISSEAHGVPTSAYAGASAQALSGSYGGQAASFGTKIGDGDTSDSATKKKGGGGGGSKKDKEPNEYWEEFDEFYDLNQDIDTADKKLKNLKKKSSKMSGKELAANLKEQNALLDKQKEGYEKLIAAKKEKMKAVQKELQSDELLKRLGQEAKIEFKDNGEIANYAEATKAAYQKYLLALDHAGEAEYDALMKDYEHYKKLIEEYKTVMDEIDDTELKIDDAEYEKIENNFKAWEAEIQLQLDLENAQQDWYEFLRKMNTDFRLQYTNPYQATFGMVEQAESIAREIGINIGAMEDIGAEIDKFMAGGESDMFHSLSEAQTEMGNYLDQMMAAGEELYDLAEEAWDIYIQIIDEIAEQFEDIIKKFERINESLEHNIKLTELLYGDDSYDKLSDLYEAKVYNDALELDSYRQQVAFWEKETQIAKQLNGEDSEDYYKMYNYWQEAIANLESQIEKAIEDLQAQIENKIDGLFSNIEQTLTKGWGYQGILDEWDSVKSANEGNYDEIERIYQLQSLQNKWNELLKDNNTVKVQQKLADVMAYQLETLTNKATLTEKDIELAEQQLEVAKAQAALEDAQNAKQSMKLVRGADGNWSYQYVADVDEVTKKQQEALDAQNEMYESSKESLAETLEDMMNMIKDYNEQLAELYKQWYKEEDPTKRAALEAQIAGLQDRLASTAANSLDEIEYLSTQLGNSSSSLLYSLYNAGDLSGFTDETLDFVTKMLDEGVNSWSDFSSAASKSFNTIAVDGLSLAEKLSGLFGDNTQLGKFFNDLSDASGINLSTGSNRTENQVLIDSLSTILGATLTPAVEDLADLATTYWNTVGELTQYAGYDFTNIDAAIEKNVNATYALKDDTETMVKKGTEYLTYMQKLTATINAILERMKPQMFEAGNKALNAMGVEGNLYEEAKANQNAMIAQANSVANGYIAEMKKNGQSTTAIEDLAINLLRKAGGSLSSGAVASISGLGTTSIPTLINSEYDAYIKTLTSSIGNALQTSVATMVADITKSIIPSGVNSITNNNGNVTYNVEANFPNADDVSTIQEAILSLPNIVSQYINR